MLFDWQASVDLQTKFQSFNELYFHGSLPKYRILVCSKARKKRFEEAYAAGFCSSKKREIRISSSVITDTKNLETTLLHEMIHAKSGPFSRPQVHG